MDREMKVNRRRKILIPYFLAGEGHILAARSIAYYVEKKKPEWETRLIEPAEEFRSEKLDKFYRQAWKKVLTLAAAAKFMSRFLGKFLDRKIDSLSKKAAESALAQASNLIQDYRPDLIMATHWGCVHLFDGARKKEGYEVPLYYLRNELGGAYVYQDCGFDLLFVTSDEAEKDFIMLGVPEEKLRRINFLVRPQCIEEHLTKNEARKRLDIPLKALTIMLTLGGEGVGFRHTSRFVDTYLRKARENSIKPCFLVITGRNNELRLRLEKRYRKPEAIILGYRKDMHLLIASADIVAGKCGAIYSMEAAALHKPFIITFVGAPNEEANKKFILNHGFGWYTPSPSKFEALIDRIMKNPEVLEEKEKASSRIPLKSGAEEIAEAIVERLENPEEN